MLNDLDKYSNHRVIARNVLHRMHKAIFISKIYGPVRKEPEFIKIIEYRILLIGVLNFTSHLNI